MPVSAKPSKCEVLQSGAFEDGLPGLHSISEEGSGNSGGSYTTTFSPFRWPMPVSPTAFPVQVGPLLPGAILPCTLLMASAELQTFWKCYLVLLQRICTFCNRWQSTCILSQASSMIRTWTRAAVFKPPCKSSKKRSSCLVFIH